MLVAILMLSVIGAAVGWVNNLVFRERGMKLINSIVIGASASLMGGLIIYGFELAGYGIYGAITALVVLFTFNVFISRK